MAILLGNAIYFGVLYPALPAALKNQPWKVDAGLLLDFFICLLVYGAIRLGVRHARRLFAAPNAGKGR